MDKRTIVFPTARAIRHEQSNTNESSIFLPNFLTMGDFISKLCIVDGYKFIDDDSRILLLLEASDFQSFSKLQIERNFFTFTKNSNYIFKFFSELSAEKYDIENLKNADLYAEYEEHITILIELYKRYEVLCDEKKYLDKIFLPKLYKFNSSYAKLNRDVVIKVDGHITNFEFELFEHYIKYANLTIIFTTSEFNLKMQERFSKFGIDMEKNTIYTIDFNKKHIVFKKRLAINSNIQSHNFSEALLQVAFAKKKIYDFVVAGYDPNKIAIVVPDEKMAVILKSFDDISNLNLAMGISFKRTEIYTKMDATIKMIEQKSQENISRLKRVEDRLYDKLYDIYYKDINDVNLISILEDFKQYFSDKIEVKIYNEELFKFDKLLKSLKNISIKAVLNIFMQRLATRVMDDIRGGKIVVLGVLETRSVEFDAVIVLDFDDKNVPKRSDKDMFLNTKIREIAQLPTMADRENLQKHYYFMLLNSAKEVAISYVKSSENSGSRFLKNLDIKEKNIYDELMLTNILFKKSSFNMLKDNDTVIKYSFKNVKVSASSLKAYLVCKRKYYYKYIKKISSHDIPSDMPKEFEIGNDVHIALKELYSKQDSYLDEDALRKDLYLELDKIRTSNEFHSYLIDIQKKRLELFVHNEVKRFNLGYKVLKTEQRVEIKHNSMLLHGYIDRIDILNNKLEILDYKTGKYPLSNKNNFQNTVDFQLEFYYLLASSIGEVSSCAFYDLKKSKIFKDDFFKDKLKILNQYFKEMSEIEELEIKKCEDTKHCLYCEYALICHR